MTCFLHRLLGNSGNASVHWKIEDNLQSMNFDLNANDFDHKTGQVFFEDGQVYEVCKYKIRMLITMK